MFDIGFGELLLVMVLGLIVLGPERLPVAVRTVASWIRTLRSLASTVQNELSQELKLQEFQESLKKVEKASLQNLSPELKASMDELKEAAEAMKRGYTETPSLQKSDDHQKSDGHSAAMEPQHNTPLNDPEAAYDGVIEAETAVRPADSQPKPENGAAVEHHHDGRNATGDEAVGNDNVKPEQSQSSAVSARQPSDSR
ncbi:Sec-independent protein translocase protein TatB [Pectobacterium punjabense]|uniref:Sec-independent protein translocase protein TatB n=1 Tax=Pectobacterium punjabense TaxID=2108399 RepID=UPI001968FC88|nr:Sec-independent protein translocase protein TatB [Pectobacterium punjabense]GKW13925.1 sec-independent protein translocase protein TatB [Pectobacterium carotovorum subsp. carotovorum]MBN3135579.1 Sec-independent protein translocase subunit TatB [Pectobacterium punjabense]MBT9185034.1 Sec-independent protein translocase subunit TatB [Pectobacterium punjabense]MCE5382451.1 Sec-independent protein translocase subunit TatB [Pectobacterium punjabense]MDG0799227.1 Sec-independent protein transloc